MLFQFHLSNWEEIRSQLKNFILEICQKLEEVYKYSHFYSCALDLQITFKGELMSQESSGGLQANLLPTAGSLLRSDLQRLRTSSSWVLKAFKDGDCTASLGRPLTYSQR